MLSLFFFSLSFAFFLSSLEKKEGLNYHGIRDAWLRGWGESWRDDIPVMVVVVVVVVAVVRAKGKTKAGDIPRTLKKNMALQGKGPLITLSLGPWHKRKNAYAYKWYLLKKSYQFQTSIYRNKKKMNAFLILSFSLNSKFLYSNLIIFFFFLAIFFIFCSIIHIFLKWNKLLLIYK